MDYTVYPLTRLLFIITRKNIQDSPDAYDEHKKDITLSKLATGLDHEYQPKKENFSAEHPHNRF